MKIIKAICLLMCVLFVFGLCGCEYEPQTNKPKPEQPHLYWKDIDVVVTQIDHNHWYAGYVHHYKVTVTVYSEEYNLTKTLTQEGSGMFGAPQHWDTQKGDIIKVKLYSWVYDSTGVVQRREIHSFS